MANPNGLKNYKFKQARFRRLRKTREHIKKILREKSDRLRLVVHRTIKHVYAQLVDDSIGKTVLAVSSHNLSIDVLHQNKVLQSHDVGILLAKKAKEKGLLMKVAFDRSGFKYHGRIKALADGAREGGIDF